MYTYHDVNDKWFDYLKSKNLDVLSGSNHVPMNNSPKIYADEDKDIEKQSDAYETCFYYASARLSLETKPEYNDFSFVKEYEDCYWVKLSHLDAIELYFGSGIIKTSQSKNVAEEMESNVRYYEKIVSDL